MFKEMIDTRDSLKMSGCTTNINERVNYTANTGTAYISTANTNLNGTGTIVQLLATGATSGSVGTLVKKFTIHGRGSSTRGMVRLFVYNGETFTHLIEEIDIAARVQLETQDAFDISFDVDWSFGTSLFIGAATNNAEGFVVSMEGLDLKYPT